MPSTKKRKNSLVRTDCPWRSETIGIRNWYYDSTACNKTINIYIKNAKCHDGNKTIHPVEAGKDYCSVYAESEYTRGVEIRVNGTLKRAGRRQIVGGISVHMERIFAD